MSSSRDICSIVWSANNASLQAEFAEVRIKAATTISTTVNLAAIWWRTSSFDSGGGSGISEFPFIVLKR